MYLIITSIVATAQFQDYYADKIPQASPDCGSPFRDGPTKWGGAGSWIVAVQMKNKHSRFFVCCHRSSLCHWSEVGEGGKPTPVTGFNGSTDLTSFFLVDSTLVHQKTQFGCIAVAPCHADSALLRPVWFYRGWNGFLVGRQVHCFQLEVHNILGFFKHKNLPEGSQISKDTFCEHILKWHWLIDQG